MYFIISERKSIIVADLSALKMVNELHNSRGIDNLFLNPDEEFNAVIRYCDGNPIKKIRLGRIKENYDILKRIRNAPNNFRIFAYVKLNNENLEELRNSLQKHYDFYVEKRAVED